MSARDVLAKNLNYLMDRFPETGSQKLLFKMTGVTTSTVGRIRRAEVSATIDNIEALAKAFKVTTHLMLDPRLPNIVDSMKNPATLASAAALSAEIQSADLSESQLSILANTLAAMRSH